MPEMQTATIYHRPADLPDAEYAVRVFYASAGGVRPGGLLGVATTLERARALVPRHLDYNVGRDDSDDPAIVETWM